MSAQSLCRVCLDGNVAMYCINSRTELAELYESLAPIQLNGTPETLCYICYSELKRYCRFAKLCKTSRQILSALVISGYELTTKTVDTLQYGSRMKKKYSINVLSPTVLPPLLTKYMLEVPTKTECFKVEENPYNEDQIYDEENESFNKNDMNDNDEEKDIQDDGRDLLHEEISIDKQETHTKENIKTTHIQKQPRKKTNYVCSNCSDTFTNKKKLVIHLRTHTVKTDKHINLYCDKCMKTFSKRVNFTRHMKQHLVGRMHACHICKKAFYIKANLDRHMKIHTGEKPYSCDSCGKTFNQKEHLKNHLKIQLKNHLSLGPGKRIKCSKSFEKPICDYCNKTFKNKSKLSNHIKLRHTGEKSHVCNICAKAYLQKCNLVKHMICQHNMNSKKERIEKEKTHICHICGKIYRTRRLLTMHVKIHNPSYFCAKCNKACATTTNLKKHMIKHTKEKKHTCKVCDKMFSYKSSLKLHQRIHTGEKPFTCHDCGKTFGQRICLIKHSRVHTGIKPFACEYCDKRFTQKNSLTHHLKTIHH